LRDAGQALCRISAIGFPLASSSISVPRYRRSRIQRIADLFTAHAADGALDQRARRIEARRLGDDRLAIDFAFERLFEFARASAKEPGDDLVALGFGAPFAFGRGAVMGIDARDAG